MLERNVIRGIVCATALILLPAFGDSSAGARAAEIEATLILASNDPAPLDTRLDGIEFRLRKVIPYEHFRLIDQKSVNLSLPGQTSLSLGQGFALSIDASKADGGVRAKVNWTQGTNSLVNSSVVLKKGSPAVLGGIPHQNGKLLVLLRSK